MQTPHEKGMVVLLLPAAPCGAWEPGQWAGRGAAEERVSTGMAPPHPRPPCRPGSRLALAAKSGSATSLCVCPRLALWRSMLSKSVSSDRFTKHLHIFTHSLRSSAALLLPGRHQALGIREQTSCRPCSCGAPSMPCHIEAMCRQCAQGRSEIRGPSLNVREAKALSP